jgi:prevent-host-death family protein
MKEIAISEFKAKCLGILEEVRKTRKPIRVTRFGKPVADVPPSPRKPVGKRLGSHPLMKLLLAASAKVFDLTLVTADEKLIAAPGVKVQLNR